MSRASRLCYRIDKSSSRFHVIACISIELVLFLKSSPKRVSPPLRREHGRALWIARTTLVCARGLLRLTFPKKSDTTSHRDCWKAGAIGELDRRGCGLAEWSCTRGQVSMALSHKPDGASLRRRRTQKALPHEKPRPPLANGGRGRNRMR